MTEYWRLNVMDVGGISNHIFGTEESLRASMNEWKKLKADVSVDPERTVICVEGITDTIDRAAATLMIPLDQIRSMCLVRIA